MGEGREGDGNRDLGASASADRATAVEPVPVSPLRDGIPSAEELQERLADAHYQRLAAVEMLCLRLGYQIRAVRLTRGLRIAELAAIVGCSVQTLTKLERGEHYTASLHLIAEIAFALDTELQFRFALHTAQGMSPGTAETETGSGPQDGQPGPKDAPKLQPLEGHQP